MRIQVEINTEYGNFRKGERLNLPRELADELVKKGVAQKMSEIGYEKKVVPIPENKGRRRAASGAGTQNKIPFNPGDNHGDAPGDAPGDDSEGTSE